MRLMGGRPSDIANGLRCVLGIVTHRVLTGPRLAAVILSSECNSRCAMCWYHSPLVDHPAAHGSQPVGRAFGPRFMAPELFRAIVTELHEMGTPRVVLGGAGEPTLHPDIDSMLALLGRLGMSPYVITNGLALDERRARRWGETRAHFRVSMHAGDAGTWVAVHPTLGAADFERASSAIRTLAASGRATVSTMNVVQKVNFRAVERMVEHAHGLGASSALFLPVRAQGALASLVTLSPDEDLESREHMVRAALRAKQLGLKTNLDDYVRTSRHVAAGVPDTSELYQTMPCYVGWTYTEFDIDGAMRPCENSEIVFGHAGRQSIRDMWLSPAYQAFRRRGRKMPARSGRGTRASRRDTRHVDHAGGPQDAIDPSRFVPGCLCGTCCMVKFNLNVLGLLRLRSWRYDEA